MLTLLIHLGYLTWNEEDGMAHIPNEEVRLEFRGILKGRECEPEMGGTDWPFQKASGGYIAYIAA